MAGAIHPPPARLATSAPAQRAGSTEAPHHDLSHASHHSRHRAGRAVVRGDGPNPLRQPFQQPLEQFALVEFEPCRHVDPFVVDACRVPARHIVRPCRFHADRADDTHRHVDDAAEGPLDRQAGKDERLIAIVARGCPGQRRQRGPPIELTSGRRPARRPTSRRICRRPARRSGIPDDPRFGRNAPNRRRATLSAPAASPNRRRQRATGPPRRGRRTPRTGSSPCHAARRVRDRSAPGRRRAPAAATGRRAPCPGRR